MRLEVGARFLIRGRVQGVGYRLYVQREAAGLRLRGFVRNRADGGVEVAAVGAAAEMAALEGKLRRGPAGAAVMACERSDWRPSPAEQAGLHSFTIAETE